MPLTNNDRVFVQKGWGFEDWIENTPAYCGKVLFVKQGKRCSWHYHEVKRETFFITKGKLLLRYITPEYVAFALQYYQGFGEKILDGKKKNDLLTKHIQTVGNCYQRTILKKGDSFLLMPGTIHQFEAIRDTYVMELSTEHKEEDSIRLVKGD